MRNVTQYGISAIAVGAYFSIAIRDERVYIWMKYDVGQCTVPRYLQRITQINAVKGNNTIALRRDGTVVQGFFGDPTDVPLDIRATI